MLTLSQYLPHSLMMQWQPKLNEKMRCIMYDWMGEVADEFNLQRTTLHMAFNFTDRFLSVVPAVAKGKLQLVGVTSLFVAAKLEELYPPGVAHFARVTDGYYSAAQVFAMEKLLLAKLEWNLHPPTIHVWSRLYVQLLSQWDVQQRFFAAQHRRPAAGLARRVVPGASTPPPERRAQSVEELIASIPDVSGHDFDFALYLTVMDALDMAMLDISALYYAPSELAAAAFLLALRPRYTDPKSLANAVLAATGFSTSQLEGCVLWVLRFCGYAAESEEARAEGAARHRNVLEGKEGGAKLSPAAELHRVITDASLHQHQAHALRFVKEIRRSDRRNGWAHDSALVNVAQLPLLDACAVFLSVKDREARSANDPARVELSFRSEEVPAVATARPSKLSAALSQPAQAPPSAP